MDEENVVFMHNGILFRHKEDGILFFPGEWMKLVSIILSKVSQAQKAKNCMFFLMCGL
jgi:hypothetical protein